MTWGPRTVISDRAQCFVGECHKKYTCSKYSGDKVAGKGQEAATLLSSSAARKMGPLTSLTL